MDRKKKLCLLVSLAIILVSPLSMASVVKGDIPYQTYRDFAENKGGISGG